MVSPRVKFIAVTVDELVLVPVVIAVVWFLAPEFTLLVSILMIVGAVVFVAAKYYLIYPSLQDSSYALYELKGLKGKVIETVTDKSGKIKVGAEIWDARCHEGDIPPGVQVTILAREDMTVRVRPAGMENE
ncbi:MAG: NfeD family protein [Candidatus Hodarchaeota archaeon]